MQSFTKFYKTKQKNCNENSLVGSAQNEIDSVKRIIDLAWVKHKNKIVDFLSKLCQNDNELSREFNSANFKHEKKINDQEVIKPSSADIS